MRHFLFTTILPLTITFSAGCDTGELGVDSLTAGEELLITTISGEEEALVGDIIGDEVATIGAERPEMFRMCESDTFFDELFTYYDENISGSLESEEREEILAGRPTREEHEAHRLRHMMDMLIWVYDLDESGIIEKAERPDLFDDFTIRCEVLHEKVLADFDADGDGELSDEEKQAAHDAQKAKHDANKKEFEKEGKPHKGKLGSLFGMDPPNLPKFAQEFDLDEDDDLNAEELATLRSTMRDRIVSGERLIEKDKDCRSAE